MAATLRTFAASLRPRGWTWKGMWISPGAKRNRIPGNCIRKEDDMGHTSEDRMCCNPGVATPQSMVSPPRMKSHFCLAALTGYASGLWCKPSESMKRTLGIIARLRRRELHSRLLAPYCL
jgi:hypothetical protein